MCRLVFNENSISKVNKEVVQPYSALFLNIMSNICTHSWFSRHKSNDAMIAGTLNEEPSSYKVHHELFILEILEVGLWSIKIDMTVGLSLDSIVMIRILDMIT